MSARVPVAICLSAWALTACTTAPKKDLALERVRAQLEQLQADEELVGYAPLALGEAERALRVAEQSTGKENLRIHLVYMAGRQIEIARVIAQREQSEQELADLARDLAPSAQWSSGSSSPCPGSVGPKESIQSSPVARA